MSNLSCPKCKSPDVHRVHLNDPAWHPGAYRCKECLYLDRWGVFCQPQLQMDLPFEEAHPAERHRRLVHQGTVAAIEMLQRVPETDTLAKFLPENAVLDALLRGDLQEEEVVTNFREALADIVAYKKAKSA